MYLEWCVCVSGAIVFFPYPLPRPHECAVLCLPWPLVLPVSCRSLSRLRERNMIARPGWFWPEIVFEGVAILLLWFGMVLWFVAVLLPWESAETFMDLEHESSSDEKSLRASSTGRWAPFFVSLFFGVPCQACG